MQVPDLAGSSRVSVQSLCTKCAETGCHIRGVASSIGRFLSEFTATHNNTNLHTKSVILPFVPVY
jgi:hypothetical protein